MVILGIESSAVSAGAAVVKDGLVVSESFVNAGLTHSKTLMNLVHASLENASLTLADVDILAVSAGPGSFTGVRIGVSAVKGLAFPGDKPCYGISSLEGIAHAVFAEGAVICPVMDARCNQVYNALFRVENGELTRLCPDRAVTLDELYAELENTDEKILLAGDGTELTLRYFEAKGKKLSAFSPVFRYQHASGVAIAAQRLYNSGVAPVTGAELQPDYHRISQAERELKKKKEQTQ